MKRPWRWPASVRGARSGSRLDRRTRAREDLECPRHRLCLGRIGPAAAAAEPALLGLLDSGDRQLALVDAWRLLISARHQGSAERTLPVLIAGLKWRGVGPPGRGRGVRQLGPGGEATFRLQSAGNDQGRVRTLRSRAALLLIRGSQAPEK